MNGRSGTPLWRNRSVLAVIGLIAVLALVLQACTSGSDSSSSGGMDGINDRREAAGLNPLTDEQIMSAGLTYLPSGEHDPYIMFASGGHSGQMYVIGVPSMRMLKSIGDITPAPWQG